MAVNSPLNRKLRMGLIGGGQGAFIGRVHATAAIMDNRAALIAGALSSDPKKSKERFFQGRVWVDDQDLQIVKVRGKGVPEEKNNKYPTFETYRENIDGKYWFPSLTFADEQLVFNTGQVAHIRLRIKFSDYERFKAKVRVIEGDKERQRQLAKAVGEFLDRIAKRATGSDFKTLNWIAATCDGLAEGKPVRRDQQSTVVQPVAPNIQHRRPPPRLPRARCLLRAFALAGIGSRGSSDRSSHSHARPSRQREVLPGFSCLHAPG